MKNRLISISLIVVLLIAFSSIAQASSNPVPLKTGMWYSLKDEYPSTVYKLTITDNAVVKINLKGNINGEIRIAFHTDEKCNQEIYSTSYLHEEKGVEMFSLSKGVFFILMENNAGVDGVKAKIVVQSALDQGNYKKLKAASLKANKLVYVVNTPDCCYTRWYKIKLNKRKRITVCTNDDHADRITIYNTKMNRIKCAVGDKSIISENSVEAGIYFIRVVPFPPFYSAYLLDEEYVGDCTTIKWK